MLSSRRTEYPLELLNHLRQSGLVYKSTMEIDSDSKKNLQFLAELWILFFGFFGNESYGPYVLYTRPLSVSTNDLSALLLILFNRFFENSAIV